MKQILLSALFLLLALGQGAWAQTTVTTESELRTAVQTNQTVTLGEDIALTAGRLVIDGTTVNLNLNGHTLSRSLSAADADGQVVFLQNSGKLTVSDNEGNEGKMTGGWSFQGGAIYVGTGCELTISGGTITGNRADQIAEGGYGFGGAIENHGTTIVSGGTISGNTAGQYGGGIYNAEGATLTVSGGTISGNTAATQGGGIYHVGLGGTLNMLGSPVVQSNSTDDVRLASGQIVTVTGAFTAGARIGVAATVEGVFTTGYGTYNPDVAPDSYFFVSSPTMSGTVGLSGGEASITQTGYTYIERSWDETNKVVVATQKTCTDYTVISGSNTEGWIPLEDGKWYVVNSSTVEQQTLNVTGTTAHLILCDGASITLTGGVKLLSGHQLNIYGQSSNTGQLIVTNEYTGGAGIGSGSADDGDAGRLNVHGGTINATGNINAAGIGGGEYHGFALTPANGGLTVYGGTVTAQGGDYGAGIGSGNRANNFAGYVTVYGGKVKANGAMQSAGIGGGNQSMGAILNIYGGTVEAYGGPFGAGIGGGNAAAGQQCTISGGTVTAEGGKDAAGIGGGRIGNGGNITITGGEVTATGVKNMNIEGELSLRRFAGGAGIGGGSEGACGNITITGGKVTAESGGYYYFDNNPVGENWWSGGAGIGGGYSSGGGTITISGGTIYANGNYGGAAIGTGDDCSSSVPASTITISGGEVYASALSPYSGAAIGFGRNYEGAAITVNISGGEVIAKAAGENATAFGKVGDSNDVNADDLTIPDSYMVKSSTEYVENYDALTLQPAVNRKQTMTGHKTVRLQPCDHSGATYTVSGTSDTDTHLKHCAYCTTTFTAEKHDFSDGKCSVCGVETTVYTVTIYYPQTSTDNDYTSTSYQMVPNTTFNLPAPPTFPAHLEFVGWLVGTHSNSSFIAGSNETLLDEGYAYTITDNTTFTARYRYLNISLADAADNGETLVKYNNMIANSVTLSGRTLYKDGSWNTLCLPFAVSDFTGTPLDGATVKTLESASFADGTLTLTFSDDLTALEAGKPYIVKWKTTGSGITNPVFNDVTISNATTDMTTSAVTFKGIFSPYAIADEDKTMLYLGAGNTLYYPNAEMTIGSCRAFFQLNDITAGTPSGVRAFVLNFGDGEASGIMDVEATPMRFVLNEWFTLDGRHLNGKPTQKGVYIYNGKKTVIK